MRIVLTGGVTGGHIYPALAIADKFRAEDPDSEFIYIGSGEPLERDIIPAHGYELITVDSDYFDRSRPIKMAKTALKTIKGRSQAVKIMKQFKPDVVISTGSYVSVPVVLAAGKLGVPLYLHEQNGFPGVSNRLGARYAKTVFLGFESAREYFGKSRNIVYSGNPVRAEFSGRSRAADREKLGIPESDLVIMVFGGSLGSATTNRIGEAVAREYADKDGYTVIWGTGKVYNESIIRRLGHEGFRPGNVRISAFIKNMPEILSASDICISRSGALSTAETTMSGRAAIFIPSPNVTADHQYYNAKAIADAGGAVIVREEEDADRTALRALGIVKELDTDRAEIRRMEEASLATAPVGATQIIYDEIMRTYR